MMPLGFNSITQVAFGLLRIPLIAFELAFFLTSIVMTAMKLVYILMAGILSLWQESSNLDVTDVNEFRKAQLFERLLNSCVRSNLFPIAAVVSPTVQILCAFALIHSHYLLGISELLFFGIFFFDSVMINVLFFTGAKQVFSNSGEWLDKMQRKHGKNKVQRRVLKSMLPLRVWFGSNWVDRMTPLVIQDFCSIQTVNLLLLV
jgi:hypothetical protein